MRTRGTHFTALMLTAVLAGAAEAQPAAVDPIPADSAASVESVTTPPAKAASTPLSQRIYYGGSFTFSIGSTTRIGIFPSVAYKITPKTSGGIGLSYEYVDYEGPGRSGHNYGVSTFARYRILPQIYGHAEYRVSSYQLFTTPDDSRRTTVPFLLLGGGYVNQISPRTWAYVEILFDVLNDPNSPYPEGEPVGNIGVSVGF